MKALSGPGIFSSKLYRHITPSRLGASYSGTGCVLQRMFQFLFIHVCSGISDSASVRLLRLDNACSAECRQLQYRCMWSTLKLHGQCAQTFKVCFLWNSSCCFIYHSAHRVCVLWNFSCCVVYNYYGISVCTVTADVSVVLCFWCLFTVCGWKVGPWVWVSQQVKEIAVSVSVKLVFVVQVLAIAGSEGVTIVTERSYGWGDFHTWKKWFEGSEHCSKSPSTWGHARCIVKQGGFETIVLLKGLTATLFRHGVW